MNDPFGDIFKNNYNNREIVVIGCKRSGHHGVIAWIRHLLEGKVLHINCVNLNKGIYERQFTVNITPKLEHNCIWNIEEYELTENIMKNISLFDAGSSKRVDIILVVRDPYNMLASRVKHNTWEYLYRENILDPYFSHIKEFRGTTHYIYNCIYVNFNLWFTSKMYRQSIARRLDLSFNDNGLNIVDNTGSIFDRFNHQHSAQEMKVLERYLDFTKKTSYITFFRRHPELFEIGSKIFKMEVKF